MAPKAKASACKRPASACKRPAAAEAKASAGKKAKRELDPELDSESVPSEYDVDSVHREMLNFYEHLTKERFFRGYDSPQKDERPGEAV